MAINQPAIAMVGFVIFLQVVTQVFDISTMAFQTLFIRVFIKIQITLKSAKNFFLSGEYIKQNDKKVRLIVITKQNTNKKKAPLVYINSGPMSRFSTS